MHRLSRLVPLALAGFVGTTRIVPAQVVDPSNRTSVVNHFNNVYTPALGNTSHGWTGSVAGCVAGTLNAQFVADTLTVINTFRAMAGLPHVTFGNPRSFATTNPNAPIADSMQGVLMMEASGQFSHNLPPTGPCGTQAGSDALVTSNLTRFAIGPRGIALLIEDANLPAVDHRRWMMHEALQQMAMGASSGFMAINVFGPVTAGQRTRFSAWPPAGFVPYQWAYDRWSFAVPAVNQQATQPGTWADFSNAVVTVRQGATLVPITYYPAQTTAYDNAIAWTFNSPLPRGPAMNDTPYTVTISNVGRTAQSSYTYVVTLIDALGSTPDECGGAIVVGNGSNGPFNNNTATNSPPAWTCSGTFGNDVWFTYRATCTGATTFATCGANLTFDTALEVFSGVCGNLQSLGCNDDSCGAGSQVTVATVAGQDYKVRVGGFGGNRGTFGLTITTANCAGGSFQTLTHGCGAVRIGYSGNAALGVTTTFSLTGVTAVPVTFLGAALLATPLCAGCILGPNPQVLVPGSSLPLAIPQSTNLLGGRIYVQGADVGASNGCSTPRLTLTNTVVMTIG
jgi:hypothetical protein